MANRLFRQFNRETHSAKAARDRRDISGGAPMRDGMPDLSLPGKTGPDRSFGVKKLKVHAKSKGI